MGPETIWIFIPLGGMLIGAFAIWSDHQQKLAAMRIGQTSSDAAADAGTQAAQIQRLEDRVQVLERIVTDGGYNIATQIEALRDSGRDQRLVDEQDSGLPLRLASKENVQ